MSGAISGSENSSTYNENQSNDQDEWQRQVSASTTAQTTQQTQDASGYGTTSPNTGIGQSQDNGHNARFLLGGAGIVAGAAVTTLFLTGLGVAASNLPSGGSSSGSVSFGTGSSTTVDGDARPVATDYLVTTDNPSDHPSQSIDDYVNVRSINPENYPHLPSEQLQGIQQHVHDNLQTLWNSSSTFRNVLSAATGNGARLLEFQGSDINDYPDHNRNVVFDDSLSQIMQAAHGNDSDRNAISYLRATVAGRPRDAALSDAVESAERIDFEMAREQAQFAADAPSLNIFNSPARYGQSSTASPRDWDYSAFHSDEASNTSNDSRSDAIREEVLSRSERLQAAQSAAIPRVQNLISQLRNDIQNPVNSNQNELQHRLNGIRTLASDAIYNPTEQARASQQVEGLQTSIDDLHYNSAQASVSDLLNNIDDAVRNQQSTPVSNWRDSLDHIRTLVLRSSDYAVPIVDGLMTQIAGIQDTINQVLAGPSSFWNDRRADVGRAIQTAVLGLMFQLAHQTRDINDMKPNLNG